MHRTILRRTLSSTTIRNNSRNRIRLEEKILSSIDIQDPYLKKSLRSLGWLHLKSTETSTSSITTIDIELKLPSLLHPALSQIQNNIKSKLDTLREQDNSINFNLHTTALPIPEKKSKDEKKENESKQKQGTSQIQNIIAVYSCKGGVGKSTISLKLAQTLAKLGGRIALLDCDIYGPSLPTLLQSELSSNPTIKGSADHYIYPVELQSSPESLHQNLKLLSLGYVSPKSGLSAENAAIMRGPMATKVINQLLYKTIWGETDVLILDLPPGTGDIPLNILQEVELDGVVTVSTPSKVSLVDARKGMNMFDNMGVETLAFILNMAYLEYKGHVIYPFGRGQDFDDQHNEVFRMPLSLQMEDGIVDDNSQQVYNDIAQCIIEKLFLKQHGLIQPKQHSMINIQGHEFDLSSLQLTANTSKENFSIRFFADTAFGIEIDAYDLRILDPKNGIDSDEQAKVTKNPTNSIVSHYKHDQKALMTTTTTTKKTSSLKLFPVTLERKANHGYAIHWGDGATIIYSLKSLASLAKHISDSS